MVFERIRKKFMRPTGIVIVLAHKGTFCGSNILGETEREMSQATFDRHLPFWEHHNWPIVIICPKDSVVTTKHEVVSVGLTSHSGTNGYLRCERILELITERKPRWTIINEYDSFCLDPRPELKKGFWGNIQPGYDLSQFVCNRYPNPPWTLDLESAKTMLAFHRKYPDIEEGGFHDRLLAAWSTLSGVPLIGFHLKGFSNDTLLERDSGELERRIIHHGACWIHGVKTENALKIILEMLGRRKNV
jgi:hypothetical protein